MNKSLSRRVAAVATAATVGGLLLPFLAAGIALANNAGGTPTLITLDQTTAFLNADSMGAQTVTIKASFATASASANDYANGSLSVVSTSGLSQALAPVSCGAIAVSNKVASATCVFTEASGSTGGTDALRVFYDPTATSTYSASAVQAASNVTVSGALAKVTLVAVAPSAAQNNSLAFIATATDAGNRPVVNATSTFTVTEPTTATADLSLLGTPDVLSGTPTASPNNTGTVTNAALTTSTGGAGSSTLSSAGTVKVYAASRNPGVLTITGSATPPARVNAPGSTVNFTSTTSSVVAGLAADIATVTLAPSAQTVYAGDSVSSIVNLRNAQGNPIASQSVTATVTGASSGQFVTTVATDQNGNAVVSYTAGGVAGTDTLQLTANGKSASATISVVASPGVPVISITNPAASVPLNVTGGTGTVTFKGVSSSNAVLAGYAANLAVAGVNSAGASVTRMSLVKNSAIIDANGNFSATVFNSAPVDGDVATVTATIGTRGTRTATVSYVTGLVSSYNVRIVPGANTNAAGSTASFSATATDQFGNAIPNVSYTWTLGAGSRNINTAPIGRNSSYSYTDAGTVGIAGSDVVQVQASTPSYGTTIVTASPTANQYWVTSSAVTTQANIDLVPSGSGANTPPGSYSQSGTGPVIAQNFTKSLTASSVTPDPIPNASAPAVTRVLVDLTDTANNRLFGKSVTFSTSGVGVLTDVNGVPLTSLTSTVLDGTSLPLDVTLKGVPNGGTANFATAYVRSTQSGTQTITATVEGISTTATVTYPGQFTAATPVRALDTRTGQGGLLIGTNTAPAGPLAPNTSYTVDLAAAGIPVNTTNPYAAYVFNVTAISPNGVGNLSIAPAGKSSVPGTSLINYQPGSDVANMVVIPNTGTAANKNQLQLVSSAASANVSIDLVGYYVTAASINAAALPARLADTRTSGTAIAAGETRPFQVSGLNGIPATSAKAVALNVTAVNPGGLGNLRIFADGTALPTTSNINYIPGQDKSALVIVNLPANGKIDVYSAGVPVNVTIDTYASYDAVTSNIVTATPVRVLDTRPSATSAAQTLAAGTGSNLTVAGAAGVPANAQAVLISVTSIHTAGSTGSGNLRVYPAGSTPNVSTLNYVSPTADVANFAIVPIGTNGQITVFTNGSPTDVAIDVVGYVPAS